MARWVHFLTLYILFGSSLFWIHMGRETWGGAATRLPLTKARCDSINAVCAVVVALSGMAWLLASIANMTGDLSSLLNRETLHAFFFETSFGPLAFGRMLLFVALVAAATVRDDGRRRFSILAALVGLLLVSQAWLGHAAENNGTFHGASMIAAYVVHVLAGASWFGGLVPLALTLAEQNGGGAPPTASLSRIVSRYSAMAIVAASAVIVSGVINSFFRIGMPSRGALSGSYGTMLLGKISLVLVMLALAGLTRFVLMPRLVSGQRESVRTGMTASVCAEVAVGVLVLGAAALLGITPPPR